MAFNFTGMHGTCRAHARHVWHMHGTCTTSHTAGAPHPLPSTQDLNCQPLWCADQPPLLAGGGTRCLPHLAQPAGGFRHFVPCVPVLGASCSISRWVPAEQRCSHESAAAICRWQTAATGIHPSACGLRPANTGHRQYSAAAPSLFFTTLPVAFFPPRPCRRSSAKSCCCHSHGRWSSALKCNWPAGQLGSTH